MTNRHGILSVSVVIPARNAASVIGEQLDALHAQDAHWIDEVVVVDSFSTDATADVVSSYAARWPKVKLVVADRPGANAARNAGVAASQSAAVLLCDADDVVAPGWAAALYAALQQHDLVRGRYSVDLLNDADTIAARGSLGSTSAPDPGQVVEGLGGCCGMRRTAWQQLGGFREHHYGSDEVEFFWRAQLDGLSAGYVDDAVVNYRLRPGYRDLFRQQRAWAASRALLLKEFGRHGLIKRRSAAAALKAWGWLVLHAMDAFSNDPARKGQWVRAAANAAGRAMGSVKHRVWYL